MYSDHTSPAVLSEMDYLDVKNLAQTGEGKFLEFKRTIPSAIKIAREMAAFANTGGGTLLIGVDDDRSLVGVKGYQEEEFLLNKAASEVCDPPLDVKIEVVHFGERDLLVIRITEAENKPVFVKEERGHTAYLRNRDRNQVASRERIEVMKNQASGKSVTFEYGPKEQKLFRYLNEYGEITVDKFAHLTDVRSEKASAILVNLVSAGILNLFSKDNIDYFSFSRKLNEEQ